MNLNASIPDLTSTTKNDVPYTKLGDLWSPYKALQRIVSQHLGGNYNRMDAHYVPDLEDQLRTYKQSFISLLQNPPKNAKSRDDLRKAMHEGVTVRGIGHQVLSRELYQELCIVSDMFDLNEYVALDLLCTAQTQMAYYPDLPRGLVAVLLYYDGRKTIVSTLRLLVQSRRGVAWSTNASAEVEDLVTAFTDELAAGGLLQRMMTLLASLDLSAELELLQANLALGDAKHRSQVTELFDTIRSVLAETIYLWSRNCGLSKSVTVSLLQHLRKVRLDDSPTGSISQVTLFLQMALLASYDLSILHTREDGESIVQNLPIISEPDFVETVLKEFNSSEAWASQGLQALAMFGYAIALAALKMIPEGQKLQNMLEHEDSLVDIAINLKVFEFVYSTFLEDIYNEHLIHTQLHFLLTDFIILMYTKVKELRIKADENARIIANYSQAGLDAPPNLTRHFEYFLLALAKLYEKDPLNLELVLQFWNMPDSSNQYRSQSRTNSLAKFLQLSGDTLPASLFVPYITLLRSLSNSPKAARFCFNVLKQPGQGLSPTLAWDHFFMSFGQYYSNLRQEAPPTHDTVYFRKHTSTVIYHKGITPQEMQGLHAVLKLITTIAENDEFTRLAFCEHPGWAPLAVFLGLISCSVPPLLKADLLRALAALSKSQETASQTWNNLEASQILVTIPSTSSFQPRGIQTELEEVESRAEEYPLTRALLKLFSVLVDTGIPRTLGAGPRKPGFDPYLTFIINSVFLKFKARSYKDPNEKWEVAMNCLELFHKFLFQYEPNATDFPSNNKQNEFNSPPGFHIMIQLNTKSEFLNQILLILDEGGQIFMKHIRTTFQESLQTCTKLCLNILHSALTMQTRFFNLINTTSCPILLTSLSKLLMSINQRTGRPDYGLIIAGYISYQNFIPFQSYLAIRVLTLMMNSSLIHSQFMNILLTSDSIKQIRTAFVECLDDREDSGDKELGDNTKTAIFTLAKQCLNFSAPNLCHFMFGFDCRKNVSKTLFQLPGVMNFPRTCIHSLFAILQNTVKDPNTLSESVLESTYNMLYLLCSNLATSEPTLRLLRLQPHFFKDHVALCFKKINNGPVELKQLAWLLKTLAIELKVACTTKQLSYLKTISQLLVGLPESRENATRDDFTIVQERDTPTKLTTVESIRSDNLLVKLLTVFDFNIKEIATPEWEYFERSVLDSLLRSCETDTIPRKIDVKRLHKILVDELCTIQGNTAIGQRQAILKEIQKVLLHAVTINTARETGLSVLGFIDAWRQVTEVLVLHLPYEILSATDQQVLEIYLLENILRLITANSVTIKVANMLSGAVLLLLENLRKCHAKEMKLNILVASQKTNGTPNIIELNKSSLQNILSYLVQWISTSDVTSQTVRTNLYACLLAFLHLFDVEEVDTPNQKVSNYVRSLDNSRYKIHDQFSAMNVSNDILSAFNDKLVDTLCHDCTAGKSIVEMLAMSTFSLLVGLSANIQWILQISSKGYLKHMIEGILESDQELRNSMEPEPDENNLRNVYLYEAKMKLLIRLATTRLGAELLLEQRAMSCLSNMKVLDQHPEISKHWDKMNTLASFIPNVRERYMLLWMPCLQLCDALLTTLGTDNESAVVQIMHFLLSHMDPVESILRVGAANLSEESLKELANLTSIISRSANNDLAKLLDSNNLPQDCRAQLYRIQKLMLALLPRFTLTETNVRELLCNVSSTETSTYQTNMRLFYYMHVGCNLVLYARNVIANNGIEHGSVGVIFQPTLSNTAIITKHQVNQSKFEHAPSVGMIVEKLIATVAFYHKEKVTFGYLRRKRSEVAQMGSVELKEFVPMPREIFDLIDMREGAMEMLNDKLELKNAQMEHSRFVIEHCLYLLWAHLDYYMLRAIPKAKNYGYAGINDQFKATATLASNTEATWKVTTDDLSNLKQGLVSIFNDSFSRQLIETADDSTDADKGLLEALLRKIKRLIQFVPVK